MSSHDHADDHGEAHAVDLEPVQTLSPGEAPTPAWVPAVGVALLLATAVYGLATGRNEAGSDPGGEADAKPSPAAVAPAAPTPVPGGQPGSAARGSQPTGAQPQPTPLSPDQLAAAKKQLELAMKRGQIPTTAGGPPGSGRGPIAPTAGH